MRSLFKVLLVTASASLLCFQVIPVSANEKAINLQSDINQEASLSQEKINDYDDEANAAAKSYAAALQRAESLTIYNGQLRRLMRSCCAWAWEIRSLASAWVVQYYEIHSPLKTIVSVN